MLKYKILKKVTCAELRVCMVCMCRHRPDGGGGVFTGLAVHQIHSTQTRNSAHVTFSIFYILTYAVYSTVIFVSVFALLGCICHKLPLMWRLCAIIGGSGLSLTSLRSYLLPENPMNDAVLNFSALKLTDPKQNPYSCNTTD
jgi:hypothetical protein